MADLDLNPPTAAEVAIVNRATATAAAPAGGLSPTQTLLLRAVMTAMTGVDPGPADEAVSAAELAATLSRRAPAFRSRVVQYMVLLALLLRPVPGEVAERVASYAAALDVDEGILATARDLTDDHLALAAIDFDRNGYVGHDDPVRMAALHASRPGAGPWALVDDDDVLARRWDALADLPDGTLGRGVSNFYAARGFVPPGRPGSAPPLLAQHDWVHVLADYGTTVESELEVFALIARANDDPRGFSLLAMVVSLFETGNLARGAGLFEASPGHLSEDGMAVRVADALRRGALCAGSNDFLATDWFELAAEPVDAVRDHFGLPTKAAEARAAGSVGPWEAGGISPYQVGAGRALAATQDRAYDTFGASPPPTS